MPTTVLNPPFRLLARRTWGLLLVLLVLSLNRLAAHPMPNSLLVLDLQPGGVAAELPLPLGSWSPPSGSCCGAAPPPWPPIWGRSCGLISSGIPAR